MNVQILFIAVFGMLALVVSAICGVLVGNRLTHIMLVSSFSTLGFSGLGFGVHQFLQNRVPEFLEFLGGISVSSEFSSGESGDSELSSRSDSTSFAFDNGPGTSSDDGLPGTGLAGSGKKKNDKFGDHIMVEKIQIKNEPKLMAEAIRTMMQKDDIPG